MTYYIPSVVHSCAIVALATYHLCLVECNCLITYGMWQPTAVRLYHYEGSLSLLLLVKQQPAARPRCGLGEQLQTAAAQIQIAELAL